MSQLFFSVISESSGQKYELMAQLKENGLVFRCNCPAGAMEQFCKHRQSIISGQFASSFEGTEKDVALFKSWLSTSRVQAMLQSISAAEDEVKAAKKRVSTIKGELGRRLQQGTA